MSQNEYTRDYEDHEALTAHESQRLLSSASEEDHSTTAWRQYPLYWWNLSSEYASSALLKLKGRARRRGKQRGRSNERNGHVNDDHQDLDGEVNSRCSSLDHLKHRHPNIYILLKLFSITLLGILLLAVIIFVHFFYFTLQSPDKLTQQRITQRALSIAGPDQIQVVSVDEKGVHIQLDGRIGLSGDIALDEWLGKRQSQSWWKRKERDFVEHIFSRVKGVQVEVGQVAIRSPDWRVPRPIDPLHLVPSETNGSYTFKTQDMVTLDLPPSDLITLNIEPVRIPLPELGSPETNVEPSPTIPITIAILLKPWGPNLMSFVQHTLRNHTAYLDVRSANIRLRGMNAKEWIRGTLSAGSRWTLPGWIDVRVGETWRRLSQEIPKAGENGTNSDEFLNLTRYDFQEIRQGKQKALGLDAYAEAKNPLPDALRGHVGWSLPFGAYLPLSNSSTDEMVLLAAVATEPFDIGGESRIPLRLHGRVVPPPQSKSMLLERDQHPYNTAVAKPNPGADALSDFLSRFLRGDPNTLIVRGGSPFSSLREVNDLPGGGDILPGWLDSLLRSVSIPIAFPGSKVTDLIQNVSISDLKITPHPFKDDKLVCSGVIMGVMNMPGQLATVDVQITDLWPDVLIFNGKPPSMNTTSAAQRHRAKQDEPDPLPDPLPEHAFGRVVPRSWTPAETYIDPDDPEGRRKLLRSELKNVPFTILPGRGAEFRSFTWKIVTGEGAKAGIDGKAKARIWNSGLGKLTLSNMPVKGVFTVGKRGGDGGDDGDGDGDDGLK